MSKTINNLIQTLQRSEEQRKEQNILEDNRTDAELLEAFEDGEEMSIEDYFEETAELQDAFNVIELLAEENSMFNRLVDRVQSDMGNMTPVQAAVVNELLVAAAPAFSVENTFITLTQEAEGDEPKSAKDERSMKERAEKIINQAKVIITRLANYFADAYRRMLTGTKKIVQLIDAKIDKVEKDDVDVYGWETDVKQSFNIDGKAASARDIKKMMDGLYGSFSYAYDKGLSLPILGGEKAIIELDGEKANVMFSGSGGELKEAKYSKNEILSILKQCRQLAIRIGSTNHSAISKTIEKKSMKAIDAGEGLTKVNTFAKIGRTITVAIPAKMAKHIARIAQAV